MSIESLKCKECGAAYELDARFACENCFGPLEVAYDHSSLDAATAKRRIQAGSQGIWRYADFLPFVGRPGDPLEPGLTPLLRADRLA
jgi:threonine synthase